MHTYIMVFAISHQEYYDIMIIPTAIQSNTPMIDFYVMAIFNFFSQP